MAARYSRRFFACRGKTEALLYAKNSLRHFEKINKMNKSPCYMGKSDAHSPTAAKNGYLCYQNPSQFRAKAIKRAAFEQKWRNGADLSKEFVQFVAVACPLREKNTRIVGGGGDFFCKTFCLRRSLRCNNRKILCFFAGCFCSGENGKKYH